MSLGVAVKGPEGIVLAADSRVTLHAQAPAGPLLSVNFDNATKLLAFGNSRQNRADQNPHAYVGAITYGAAVIGTRTAASYVPEFGLSLGDSRLSVEQYTERLSAFFMEVWQAANPTSEPTPDMTFVIGGYNKDEAYGTVYLFSIPGHPDPEPRNPGDTNFGMTWGGQLDFASRLIHGFDPRVPSIAREVLGLDQAQFEALSVALRSQMEFRVPYDVLPLQDCIDLSTFLIRTTITAQNLSVGLRGVGGPIDVAVITRTDGLRYIQRKELRGEAEG